jgi:hypothetical protein
MLLRRKDEETQTNRRRGVALNTRTDSKPAPAKQTLDELVASRTAQKLPAPPVFKRELVAVPAGGRGKKGASDLEAAVRANAEAAEEARRVALAQRRALEEIAALRLEAEKQLAGLRHEMAEERSEHERLVTQARFRATQEERRRHEGVPGGNDETGSVAAAPTPTPSPSSPEMRTLQGQIAEREQLGESHRQRLLDALRERDSARLELQRVSDARTHAERRLERVTEVLHRATSAGGPRPAGDDGLESQSVRALRDELAVAIARAKSAESKTNELRDEIEAVKSQRVSTAESLEATRNDLDTAREELSGLHARLLGFEAEQRTAGSVSERVEAAEAHARDIEREVVEARSRAVEAEQRVAELTASLSSTDEKVGLSESVTGELKIELAESRLRAEHAEGQVVELGERAARVESDLALATAAQNEAEARWRATEGELVSVDGARSELDAYVDELRAAVIRHESRVADLEVQLQSVLADHLAQTTELEAKLDTAVIEHGHHAVDLEATHAATAAELTSASARAEHLATEIAAGEARIGQLEAALAATTAELGEMVDQAGKRTGDLARRDARVDDLQARLGAETDARTQVEEQLVALRAEHDGAVAECDARAAALETAEQAGSVAEAALATARAERDVAVAQADSLTLELGQRNSDVERAEARIADLDRELTNFDTDHRDALQRLEDLGRELGSVREERDRLIESDHELAARCAATVSELGLVQARADELETTRSDDRNVAEKAIEGLRTKTDSASARAVMMEEEIAGMRARHTDELERMSRELGAARSRVEAADGELAGRRAREDELHRALAVAEARCIELQRVVGERPIVDIAEIAAADERVPEVAGVGERAPESSQVTPAPPDRPVSVGAAAGDGDGDDVDRPRPPSDLRRAVFASLTELAGDG